jgi:hypothetical protein
MIVMQITSVDLKPKMADVIPYRAYLEVLEWLQQWTCQANFKAVIAETTEEGLDHCRKILQRELIPGWLQVRGIKPEMFTFRVSKQEVDSNEFWMSAKSVWIHDHNISEDKS